MIVYFGVLACLGGMFAVRNSNLATTKRSKNTIYWLAWALLIAVVALRYNVGTDYRLYRINYLNSYAFRWQDLFSIGAEVGADLVASISKWLHDDYATWFFLMAIITLVPCAIAMKRECESPCMSTVLFVLLCCWHTTFNIVLQSAAIGILLLGYRFFRERKLIKWCIVCLLASLFHVTALVMIPVYFLVTPKVSGKRLLLLLGVGALIAVLHRQLFSLMTVLAGGELGESQETTYGALQLNPLRVLVNCAPAVAATLMLRYFDLEDKKFCLLYNMSVFNAVLNVATMSSAYLNRFALYTIVFNAIFIPYLLRPFKRNTRIALWIMLLVLYGAYWAYDLYKCAETVNFYWIWERGI